MKKTNIKEINKNQSTVLFNKDEFGNYLDSKDPNFDIHIYCDGICEPNPGESGFGVVVYEKNVLTQLFYGGYKKEGTNQIAELQGLYESLKKAKNYIDKGIQVQILTDSAYAISCISIWAYSWKTKGWTRKKNQEVKNLDIIKPAHELYDLVKEHVKISHIKGHAGFEGNELADRMSVLSVKNKEIELVPYIDSLGADIIMKIT